MSHLSRDAPGADGETHLRSGELAQREFRDFHLHCFFLFKLAHKFSMK